MKPHTLFRNSALLAGIACLLGVACRAQKTVPAVATSVFAAHDAPLSLDPGSPFWQRARPIHFDTDTLGVPVPGLATTVRSRWTPNTLYLLFVCDYRELYLKPDPVTTAETDRLWNWDVAETFIGSDFQNIDHYKEFEISPQGEYVDLSIQLDHPLPQGGLGWNSGFATLTRIDPARHIWYGAMAIPMRAIAPAPVHAGTLFRINFFRAQGPPPDRHLLAWQPPMGMSFHVPQRFGLLRLTR